jgi:hypothetical protein
MRLPVQREQGLETAAGVAMIAAFVAVPTGLPLSEVVTEWLPSAAHGVSAPALVGLIWAGLFAWFWAGIRAAGNRYPGTDR